MNLVISEQHCRSPSTNFEWHNPHGEDHNGDAGAP
jgi:hypothetical protein